MSIAAARVISRRTSLRSSDEDTSCINRVSICGRGSQLSARDAAVLWSIALSRRWDALLLCVIYASRFMATMVPTFAS